MNQLKDIVDADSAQVNWVIMKIDGPITEEMMEKISGYTKDKAPYATPFFLPGGLFGGVEVKP